MTLKDFLLETHLQLFLRSLSYKQLVPLQDLLEVLQTISILWIFDNQGIYKMFKTHSLNRRFNGLNYISKLT